jgi:hypothetical protein
MLFLELMLAALLVATLVFGWRLERKLRALRDSQGGFVKAMQDLDGAAYRTQSGLEKLRQATDEAGGDLLPRIEAARAAADRLEVLTSEAEIAARRAESAAREVDASTAKLASALARARPAPAASATPAPVRPAPEPRAGQPPAPEVRLEAPEPVPEPRRRAQPEPRRNEARRTAADFAAMLAMRTTRQPLPPQMEEPREFELPGETKPAGSRLREAAALLRGG